MGWQSRGYLPHIEFPGQVQAITFRLNDSVPTRVVRQWIAEIAGQPRFPTPEQRALALRRRITTFEDAGHGICHLADPRVAGAVEATLLHGDGNAYALLAWCIMPNHVHVVVEPMAGVSLHSIIQAWKSISARRANILLGRTGPFWMREYYDRYIRDDAHLEAAIRYAENNPVDAGLCTRPEDWPWSSGLAHRRRNVGAPLR